MIQIPQWHIATNKDPGERTPLEEFVAKHEPTNECIPEEWRDDLRAAIDYAVGLALEKASLWGGSRTIDVR